MGMPVTIEINTPSTTREIFNSAFNYFKYVDEKFSTYKTTSEISLINRGEIIEKDYSKDMKEVMALSEDTKRQTNGYFDIVQNGKYDPSGLVKGWAIYNAANILREKGVVNFYVEAGGDIQVSGHNQNERDWKIGIRSPFDNDKIVKIVYIQDLGIATSGTYLRGRHIYNPKEKIKSITDIVSLTVIGPNIYEADRFATAAFAMGKTGIVFIENLKGFEGYMIDMVGMAVETSGFKKYTKETHA